MSTPPPCSPQPQQPAPGWWQASDGWWYPPEQHPDPSYRLMVQNRGVVRSERARTMNRLVGAGAVALVLFVAVVALLNDGDGGSGDSTTLKQTVPTAPAEQTTTTLLSVPCEPATADDVAKIERFLAGGAERLGPAFAWNRGEYRMVVAHIYDGAGKRLSSLDYWVLINGVPTATSRSARDYSDMPNTYDVLARWDLDAALGEDVSAITWSMMQTCPMS